MIMHHLHHLLDVNRAFSLNGRGTTNHCPMALHALHEMGANPASCSSSSHTGRPTMPCRG